MLRGGGECCAYPNMEKSDNLFLLKRRNVLVRILFAGLGSDERSLISGAVRGRIAGAEL